MRHRLRILRPVVEKGKLGGEKTGWEHTATAWAERVKISGSNGLEVGEFFPGFTVEFNIRDAHRIDNNWRVEQLGGYLYNVVNVIPNPDKGMLTLRCERVNE